MMPRSKVEQITGYAHCRDPRCAGYSQQEVKAVKTIVETTYVDSGGDMPGVEKSHEYMGFADASDIACPECSHGREVTDQKRRKYQPLSGHAQDGLLSYKPPEMAA